MAIKTFTLGEFSEFLGNIPKKLEKAKEDIEKDIAQSFLTRIRGTLREVSNSSTGFLRGSLKMKPKDGKMVLEAARYWKYVNAGKFPNTIPAMFIEQHIASPGTPGQWVDNPEWVPPKNTANKGFVDKAYRTLMRDMDFVIQRSIQKALQ